MEDQFKIIFEVRGEVVDLHFKIDQLDHKVSLLLDLHS